MEQLQKEHDHIKGWGMDTDRENEPTYPMKKYTGDDHKRLDYERPEQQPENIEVLHSIERPSVSAVFGTSVPPSGLSGMVRRYAFRYSEGSWGHWLPLILADRINVFEGIFDDLKHGHIPNFFAERGWKAEWKYNRKGAITKIAVTVAVTSLVVAWFVAKKQRSKHREAY